MKEQPDLTSVETKKEPEQQPRLEKLREGTWAYIAETHPSEHESHFPASSEQIVERINKALRLIDKQGGRVVNAMGVAVRSEGGGKSMFEATIMIVEKPKSKE